MTHRAGRKRKVVIPKAFREATRVDRAVPPDALMGRLAGHRLVTALDKDRRAERRR